MKAKENYKMGSRDLFLFNIVAVFGLSWFTTAAKMGPQLIVLWILAAFFFFVPEAFIITELGTTWPIEGGLSQWISLAFGKECGFINSWVYLIQQIIYFPAYLISAATFLAYFLGRNWLGDNKTWIVIISLVLMWTITILNIKGFKFSKIINRFSSFFAFGLIALLVVLCLYWVFGLHMAVQTNYTLTNIWPNFSNLHSIVFFSTMIFAFAGLEAPSSFVGRVENPGKTFPKAIFLSALCLPFLWMIGSTALTIVMPSSKIGLVSGLINVIAIVCNQSHIGWFVILMALFLFLFRLGSINAWTLSPIVMFREGSKEYLPSWLMKMDKESDTPKNALIIQAVIVSIFTFMANSMPTIESAYWIISAMASICLFIPYMYLFASFIKLRILHADVKRVYKAPFGIFQASVALIVVFIALILSCIPPQGLNVGGLVKYESELIGGPLLFIAVGYIFVYRRRKNKNVSEKDSHVS